MLFRTASAHLLQLKGKLLAMMRIDMNDLFEFHFVNDQLMGMGSVNSAAELQGVLCGRLCTGEQLQAEHWQEIALEFLDLDCLSPLSEEQEALFTLVLNRTQALLTDEQFRFTPLLPCDSAGLERRAEALSRWCEGFLYGLGQSIAKAGLHEGDKLPKDVSDALRDMAHISQAVVEDGTESMEENEVYWMELVEYVKVAVLTIYEELAGKTQSTDGDMH